MVHRCAKHDARTHPKKRSDESSKIPEKTVEQIFDERYPLDKWEDSNYSILDKFSMRGRKGFVTGAAGGLGRNAAAALAQAGADVALVDLPSQEDKLTELAKDMSERFGTNVIALTCDVTNVEQVAELKTQLVEQLGTVDFAFLNAGVNVPATIKTPPKKYGRAPSTSTSTAPTVPAASRMKSCANTVMAAH